MLSSLARRDLKLISGLIVLGLVTIVCAVALTQFVARRVLQSDATKLAQNWTRHVEGNLIPAAQGASGNGPGAEQRLENGGILNPRSFGGGGNVSSIHRYILFGPDKSPIAKSRQMTASQARHLIGQPEAAAAFDNVVKSGKPEFYYLAPGAANQASRIARVMIPVADASGVARVMVVDADQSASFTLLDGAFKTIVLLTTVLMLLGISAPVVAVWRRMRQHWQMQEKIRFLAFHDPLTGLANRFQITQHLSEALEKAQQKGEAVAVLSADIDRFKLVNDTLGHPTADALLVSIARRLEQIFAEDDVHIGRMGGDEFAFVVHGEGARNKALSVAHALRTAMIEPLIVNQHQLHVTMSIGMAVGPADGNDAATLLNHADMALERAKNAGKNTSQFFVPEMEQAAYERQTLEQDLRHAIDKEELELAYQPQFDLRTGKIVGYEALLRWNHPVRGNISPSKFILDAEESGLICAIGEWALRTGCRYAASWPDSAKVAINISPTQFMDSGLPAVVDQILEETGLDPDRLELEITESLLLHSTERVKHTLHKLSQRGISIALDDFGTGYSSLSYLARFPFNKIKIDRSFVRALDNGPDAVAIVKAIIGLGNALGVSVIAEGIETEEQDEILRSIGCKLMQGYLYGRPEAEIVDPWEATVKVAREARKPARKAAKKTA